jgi:hypothetical protein
MLKNFPLGRYDADQNKDKKSFQGNGVLICSIDNMPTQLPREATDYFGDLLLPYVHNILKSDAKKPFLENKVGVFFNISAMMPIPNAMTSFRELGFDPGRAHNFCSRRWGRAHCKKCRRTFRRTFKEFRPDVEKIQYH